MPQHQGATMPQVSTGTENRSRLVDILKLLARLLS